MLNQRLYNALQQAFGEVLIANEDQMPDIEPDPVGYHGWRIRADSGQGRGEQYHVNCPFCNDRRHRLYISSLSFASLQVRGERLPQAPLMAYCQNENCCSSRDNREALARMILTGFASPTTVTVDQASLKPSNDGPGNGLSSDPTVEGIRTWVPGYTPIDSNAPPAILEYLAGRRVTDADVQWLNIGWGPIKTNKGELLGGRPWVIFPVVQNKTLVGVQARCPDCYMPEGYKMKYWFHPASHKSAAVFNLDAARAVGVGVLCEGVFDVLSIGRPGICCFGHTPSSVQRRLVPTVGDMLIWLPDTDSNPKCNPLEIATRMTAQWNSEGAFKYGAHVVVLPEKDAGSMTRLEVWRQIISQVPRDVAERLVKTVVETLQ